jgi:hypothetical protein
MRSNGYNRPYVKSLPYENGEIFRYCREICASVEDQNTHLVNISEQMNALKEQFNALRNKVNTQ